MTKIRDIQKRRQAVESIRTVTGAMEMVASSRYHRMHKRATATRPHSERLMSLVNDIAARGGFKGLDHPLLTNIEDVKRDVLLVLTSTRGLCGPYNNTVLRVAVKRHTQVTDSGYQVQLHVVGRRGVHYLRARGYTLSRTYTDFGDFPSYDRVGELGEYLMASFTAGLIGGLEVAYMQYASAASQKPVIAQILPLADLSEGRDVPASRSQPPEFIPSAREVIRNLLPATVRLRLYQCFLDAAVSEQVARMRAMRAAVDNANDMIQDLTLRYNRLRQGQITTELAEIMGGRIGLEQGGNRG